MELTNNGVILFLISLLITMIYLLLFVIRPMYKQYKLTNEITKAMDSINKRISELNNNRDNLTEQEYFFEISCLEEDIKYYEEKQNNS